MDCRNIKKYNKLSYYMSLSLSLKNYLMKKENKNKKILSNSLAMKGTGVWIGP